MKIFVVEINGTFTRTIFSDKVPKVGTLIKDENWLGHVIKGGIITKVY